MIFDAHMHVGDFGPMFNVSLDRDGLAAIIAEHHYEGCCVFHPDNEYVRTVIESTPEAYGLVWGNPRLPGYVEEVERFSDLVRLDELLAGECTDDRAAPRPNGDEALRGEPAQGFPHGAATHTEGSREGELVELRAGRESAADDLVAEMLVDTLPKRPMVECRRRQERLRLDVRWFWRLHPALLRVINAPLSVNGRQSTLTPPSDPGNQ